MFSIIRQHIFFQETFETINLYIELRENYIYDFLDEFKDLSNQVVISNIEVFLLFPTPHNLLVGKH